MFVIKTLEVEWYAVIKAYKFTVFERFFYILCVRATATYRVYRLHDMGQNRSRLFVRRERGELLIER